MSVIAVRATINLPGLRRGQTAIADPEEPYIAECLAATWLVAEVTPQETPTGSEPRVNGDEDP